MKPNPNDELRARILASVAATPSPTRRELGARVRWLAIGALGVAAMIACMRGLPTIGAGRTWAFAIVAAGAPLVAAFGGLAALAGRDGGGRAGRRLLLLGAVAAPISVLGGYVAAARWLPESLRFEALVATDFRCLAVLMMASLLLLVPAIRLLRGSEPISPTLRGGAIAGGFATAVATGLALQCPETGPAHYLVGHVLPVLAIVAIGALSGRRWLAPRLRAR